MKRKLYAKKKPHWESNKQGMRVTDSCDYYDEKTNKTSYFQRIIQYFSGKGGECETSGWYPITKESYDLEDDR